MNANDPTYPVFDKNDEWHIGLTKREYFAAMAMQGAIASDTQNSLQAENAASYAVRCADALIAELSK